MDKERILLVDDDPRLVDSLKGLLTDYGHEVVAVAYNGSQAIEVIDDPENQFRLAVIDNEMPDEGDGERAAGYLRDKRPDVVIISYAGKEQSWGDINLSKRDSPRKLIQAIQEAE